MNISSKKIQTIIKWVILVSSYLYLAYILLNVDNYSDLIYQWEKGFKNGNILWLFIMIILIPFNWICEAQKWRILTKGIENMSISKSLKAVMAGNTAAFFTPNRIGEVPGRCAFLSKGNKKKGISLSLMVSLSQTIVITLCGVPASILYFALYRNDKLSIDNRYYLLIFLLTVLFLLFYIFMPSIVKKISNIKYLGKIEKYIVSISTIKKKAQFEVLGVTIFRYFIFCFQFYCLLQFFGVSLGIKEGVIGIATNYLFVTFTPSMAFSEGSVRASVAVLVLSLFNNNKIAIIAAGLSVWLINFVLPMVCGSWFWSHKK